LGADQWQGDKKRKECSPLSASGMCGYETATKETSRFKENEDDEKFVVWQEGTVLLCSDSKSEGSEGGDAAPGRFIEKNKKLKDEEKKDDLKFRTFE